MLRRLLLPLFPFLLANSILAQENGTDSLPSQAVIPPSVMDTTLRITNLNPYFTVHVDSILSYDLNINKKEENFFWYLKQAPVGVKLERNDGNIYFKAEKSFFKSGKLKYDVPYIVSLGVQNIFDPKERVDTSITILFYSTEITVSKLKPEVIGTINAEEGDSIRFNIQCEVGTFPIEQITFTSNIPLTTTQPLNNCNDIFSWAIPFEFIKDNDTAKNKLVVLRFIGSDKFHNKDTAEVRINVKPGINYPQKIQEHKKVAQEMYNYVQNLKLTFYVVSKNIKNNKSTRTAFDISSSTTAFVGTVVTSTATTTSKANIGKIFPSVGLTLVPVKEAVAPNKVQEQNTASQLRGITKRLEYLISENQLIGERDPDIVAKTQKLRQELKTAQLQLVDLPTIEFGPGIDQATADKYFNDPKVIKKYKLKVN
ncbi:MAG: hypothetical protein ACK4V4_04025 [Sphingobacteriales bacterium]|jgi:hypothetical protein